VKIVHRASIYRLGQPFAGACQSLLTFRHEFREAGETGWEMIVKQLSNAMSGKLAQAPFVWVPRPHMRLPIQWGRHRKIDGDSKSTRWFVVHAGMVWERMQAECTPRPMAASYAYLTSYGRVLMRLYRQMLMPRTILAQDTDGLWCTRDALTVFDWPRDSRLDSAGELRHVLESPVGRFFGPQQYWYGDGWVLSGRGIPQFHEDRTTIHATTHQSGVHTARETPPYFLYDVSTKGSLMDTYTSGVVGPDGWIGPPKEWYDYQC